MTRNRGCPGTFVWLSTLGGSGQDQAAAVAVDRLGNTIAAGVFSGTTDLGKGAVTAMGGMDIFVRKQGTDGAVLWAQHLAGPRDEHAYSVATDTGGDVFVAGDFETSLAAGATELTAAGEYDAFVAKLSGADGHFLWAVRFGSAYKSSAFAVAAGAQGDVFVTGNFFGNTDFGGTHLSSAGFDDLFVARLSGLDGSVRWARRGGGNGYDVGRGIAIDSVGNVVVVGELDPTRPGLPPEPPQVSFGGADFARNDRGESDILLAKYDGADGGHLWSEAFGGEGNDQGTAVAIDSHDNIIIGGGYWGHTVDFGAGPGDSHSYWGPALAKYAPDGGLLWVQYLPGNWDSVIRGVAIGPDDSILFAGNFGESLTLGDIAYQPAGKEDMFVGRAAPDGGMLWSEQLGGAGDDVALGIAAAGSDAVIAGSFSAWMDTCRRDPLIAAGLDDAVVARLHTQAEIGPEVTPPPAPDAGVPAASLCRAPPAAGARPAIKGAPQFGETRTVTNTPISPIAYPVAADINGDGFDDVVLAEFSGSSGVQADTAYGGRPTPLRNDGQGNLVADLSLIRDPVALDGPRRFLKLDFNADGKDDVLFGNAGFDRYPQPGNPNTLLLQRDGGLDDKSLVADPPGGAIHSLYSTYDHGIAVGDIDCDGYPDLFEPIFNRRTAMLANRISRNDRQGHWLPDDAALPVEALLNSSAATFCDVNRDGAPDLIVGAANPLPGQTYPVDRLFLNDGHGHFTAAPLNALPPHVSAPSGTYDYACADFDGDGWNDLMMLESNPSGEHLSVWRNKRDGTFENVTASSLPQLPAGGSMFLWVGDFNGDGWPDVLYENNTPPCAGSVLLLNQGDGTFGSFNLGFASKSSAGDVQCAELIPMNANGDARPDLFVYPYIGGAFVPKVLLNTTP